MAKFLFYDDQIINILLKEEQPSGGAAVQAYGWVQGLLALGHEVHIMTDMGRIGTLKEECDNIKFVPVFDSSKGMRWFRWLYYRIPFLYREIRKVKPDYLYKGIPSWHSFVIGLICRSLNIKFIQRISNDFLVDKRHLKHYSIAHLAFQNMGMKLSDYILCQNEYQYNNICRQFPQKAVMKITNPFYLKPNKEDKAIELKEYIAWLGLFQYQKNLKLLFEIASNMTKEKFLIAGEKSRDADQDTLYYLEMLEKLPNVEFYGFIKRNQVLAFLSGAKFLLNTSHYEGFSNTFLEAMAIGTPILTSKNVNPDNIIPDYNLGVVYEDATDLIVKLSRLTPECYEHMSVNVQKYVATKHNYRILTEKLLSFLTRNQINPNISNSNIVVQTA